MKKQVPVLVIPFLSLMLCATAFAAPKEAVPVPEPDSKKTSVNGLQDEAAYTQYLTDYYRKDSSESKKQWAQKTALLKQAASLREKATASKNPSEKKELEGSVLGINKELGILSEKMAKKDLENAEFSLKAAERRLEKSKENLARVQESNKKFGEA